MGTSTVLSAMEWQQPSWLPTTSSGDICMPACKLHKHQRVSSGLSHLIKRVVNDQIANRDLKLKFISIRKAKAEEAKVKHTHRFKDRIFVIQQR